jgi:aspartyl-tRNA(Asn)/glutamyl-tRNA(Gln) amidotransferase subunit C
MLTSERQRIATEETLKAKQVAAADVEPTASPIPRANVYRDDVPEPSLPVDEALRNARERDGDRFRVPRIAETGA